MASAALSLRLSRHATARERLATANEGEETRAGREGSSDTASLDQESSLNGHRMGWLNAQRRCKASPSRRRRTQANLRQRRRRIVSSCSTRCRISSCSSIPGAAPSVP